ncbi:MAG: hypothetical protein QOF14_1924 [Hyphomicrobiales bacterium]|jgi:hypothetical protein|nr:hypothetical protein [Hyphomicrobiales bacterium]
MGYAARGVVFIIISAFAFLAALGSRNHTVGTKGALEALLSQPFGRLLLWLVAAGLLFFGLWRILQAVFDTDNCGRDNKGVLRRLGMLGGAVINLALGCLALSVIFGFRALADEDATARDWTAWLLSRPFGQMLVMLVGASIVVTGIAFVWKAVQAEFREQIAADSGKRVWIVALGQFGYVTRGVVFALIGIFLMVAARKFSSGEAAGLAGALGALRQQPYGPYLLGIAALGLLSYGAFEVLQVFLRRINVAAVDRPVGR